MTASTVTKKCLSWLSAGVVCSFALHALMTSVFAQLSAVPSVLTVCEALRNLNRYKGTNVVVVGRSKQYI